jgi:hypothetical protein
MKNIKLTNYEIRAILGLLQRQDGILNSDKPYPLSILWVIDENRHKLYDIAVRIDEADKKIRDKYSDDEHSFEITLENGNTDRQVKDEYIKDFQKELTELNNITNEISVSTINYNDLVNYEISGKDLQSVKFMIEKPEETEVEVITE